MLSIDYLYGDFFEYFELSHQLPTMIQSSSCCYEFLIEIIEFKIKFIQELMLIGYYGY